MPRSWRREILSASLPAGYAEQHVGDIHHDEDERRPGDGETGIGSPQDQKGFGEPREREQRGDAREDPERSSEDRAAAGRSTRRGVGVRFAGSLTASHRMATETTAGITAIHRTARRLFTKSSVRPIASSGPAKAPTVSSD